MRIYTTEISSDNVQRDIIPAAASTIKYTINKQIFRNYKSKYNKNHIDVVQRFLNEYLICK
jgi:hypothetical protein